VIADTHRCNATSKRLRTVMQVWAESCHQQPDLQAAHPGPSESWANVLSRVAAQWVETIVEVLTSLPAVGVSTEASQLQDRPLSSPTPN
jgi:hypothetical protein